MIFEKAIKNASPIVEVKARRIGGSTYQVPIEVSVISSNKLSIKMDYSIFSTTCWTNNGNKISKRNN